MTNVEELDLLPANLEEGQTTLMLSDLQIRVYRNRELCHTTNLRNELQIGRQRPGEPQPYFYDTEKKRLIVAPIDDKLVSREHLLLKLSRPAFSEHDQSRVFVKNLSRKRSVMIDSYGKLGPEEQTELTVPILISFEDFAVRVEQPQSERGKSTVWSIQRWLRAVIRVSR